MNSWQPIETAPKNGTIVLLLSKDHSVEVLGETIHHPPKASIGCWNAEGDAWCDQYGRFPDDPEVDTDTIALHVTGVWNSGGGWFQPNEVTHWMPIPEPPQSGE